MSDQGTEKLERKIEQADKAGAAKTGSRPNESEGQRREREQHEQGEQEQQQK